MINKVFSITGNKVASFIIDEDSLKFSSQNMGFYTEFQKAWNRKLSLATKTEVRFENIKSIKKEDNDADIYINHRGFAGVTTGCVFSFNDKNDYEVFYNYFINEKLYQRTDEKMAPFKAIRNYLLGLAAAVGVTVFAYSQAIDIANGTLQETSSGKERLFNMLIGFLGDKGVIALGVLGVGYLGYKIWSRFKNPPIQMILLPPDLK
jgi:hypothetical protein